MTGPLASARLDDEVVQFLYREAALLDERRLEEWLALFAEDGRLWVPGGWGTLDPDRQVSIIYDNLGHLRSRVTRLLSGREPAQDPPSRTIRQVSNVVVEPGPDGLVGVSSVVVVHETRAGRPLLVLPSRVHHRLRREVDDDHVGGGAGGAGGDGGDHGGAPGFRIVEKRIKLLEVERHFENLTFLL